MRLRAHARSARTSRWAWWGAGASLVLMALAGPADAGATAGRSGPDEVGHGAEAGVQEGRTPALRIVASSE